MGGGRRHKRQKLTTDAKAVRAAPLLATVPVAQAHRKTKELDFDAEPVTKPPTFVRSLVFHTKERGSKRRTDAGGAASSKDIVCYRFRLVLVTGRQEDRESEEIAAH